MRLFFVLGLAALLAGCSLPRIIVLNDPLDARQHNDLGVSYQQRGETDLAIREYNRAAELAGGWAMPLINRGNALAARGDWWQAEKSYRLALGREPGNAEAMNNLAWALLQVDETEAALEWAEKAAVETPRDAAVLDTLAAIRIARQDYPEARRIIDRALPLNPAPHLRHALEEKKALLDALSSQP
jgi:Flp pilus assembly protein TadD